MAKKKVEKDDGGYLWFKATVDCGELTFRYRLKDAVVDGGETHDENVEDWSDDDIKNLAFSLFDVPKHMVIVEYN